MTQGSHHQHRPLRSTLLLPLSALALILSTSGCTTDPIQTHKEDTGDPIVEDPEADSDSDGWTVGEGDCNDHNSLIHPGMKEVSCDGLDNDCQGGDLTDQDGDGYDCTTVGGSDCADNNPDINPGIKDICGDLVDLNCDRLDECDCDGDGEYGDQCSGLDCDDSNAEIHPGAEDECYDGVDSDCSENEDNDCDGDGHVAADLGGDDCDDTDDSIYPGRAEICMDSIDNDCNPATADCDCDADGYNSMDCPDKGSIGDDCDDDEATVNPGMEDTLADDLDNNCDGEVDEDAYCNLYAPFSNGSTASRSFVMIQSGFTYDELDTINSWDHMTGRAQLTRALSVFGTAYTDIVESWTCDGTGVYMNGYSIVWAGMTLFNVSFTTPRLTLPTEDLLTEGQTWDYSYREVDAATGPIWNVEGTYTVQAPQIVSIGGVDYDSVVITNDYVMTDLGGSFESRTGSVENQYVARLGMVLGNDLLDSGETYETRTLTAFSGFYP